MPETGNQLLQDLSAVGREAVEALVGGGPPTRLSQRPSRRASDSAKRAQLHHIELKWRDALRIDVLTDNLCMIASSYTDVIEPRPASRACRGTQTGYFTGLAEMRNGPVAISRFPLVGAGGFRQSPITLRRDPPVRNPSHKFLRDFRFAGLPGLDRPRFAKTSSVVFSARLPPVTGN